MLTEAGERPPERMTTPLSEDQVAEIREIERHRAQVRQVSVTIYHRDSIRVVPLVEGRRVVIGRSEPATVAIRDGSLSRQHAAVELVDGRVWIEDLGSTNGTWVNGLRVERLQVAPGSELMLGGLPASVDVLGAGDAGRRGLLSHDRFVGELAAELARARRHGRTAALLMLRAPRHAGAATSPGRWFPQVQQRLQPYDCAALYSGDTAELLLPELSLDQALDFAAAVRGAEGRLHVGIGVYPLHATSAEELLEVTRCALQRARVDGAGVEVPAALAAGARALDGGRACCAGGPVVASPAMERVYQTARRVASAVMPVLVIGETGTGKEVVARAIHEAGRRRERPLICVNCGALPPQLVEATLFGHEKGAFTGASQQARGVFEAADGGTVFLDEIGELQPPAQAALLRVLETRRFARVGSVQELEADVRVVAATHRDLERMCAAGEFRADLLYRLNAMVLELPPLRERRSEIEPLTRRFVALANEANGCAVTAVAEEALDLLLAYAWPGNVRELRNVVERAVVIAEGSTITIDDLPRPLAQLAAKRQRAGLSSQAPDGPADAAPARHTELPDEIDLRAELEVVEARLLRTFLDRTGWDRKEAARRLGIPLRTLAHKIMVHGLSRAS